MRNRVEILRAIEYTKDNLDNISNLDEVAEFSDKDKEFMEEFKKIYELGLNQLEKFINKLVDEGKDLDPYSIKYYVNVLLNGPLGQYVRQLSEDKTYFVKVPDSLGILGNKLKSTSNRSVASDDMPLGVAVDLYNKIPLFMQKALEKSIEQTEKFFRSNLNASIVIDNTLPIVDKRNQNRYDKEPTGELALEPVANYLLKDVYFYEVLDEISIQIYDLIKEYLGDENYRIFKDNKEYNPFDDINDSTSKSWTVKTTIEENGKSKELDLDIYGNVIDSEEKRRATLKVSSPEKDKEYNLGSVGGQLGT